MLETDPPRAELSARPPPPRALAGLPNPRAEPVHQALFLAFLSLTGLLCVGTVLGARLPAAWSWSYGAYLALAAFTMLAALARWLPLQNVVACGLVLSLTSAVTVALSARTGFPLGRFQFHDTLGQRWVEVLAWPVPLLWVALLLASRQTARVILQPWRRAKGFGWWLLALATLLTLIHTLALDPFGHRVMGWWSWPKPEQPFTWYGAPLTLLAGTVGLSLILLLLAGPWLIPKRRTGRLPDFEPVYVWLGLLLWWAVGDLRAGLWAAGVLALLAGAATFGMAWRSARLSPPPASLPPHST